VYFLIFEIGTCFVGMEGLLKGNSLALFLHFPRAQFLLHLTVIL
jgi:hypothetical protein